MNSALALAVRHRCAELDPAAPSTKAFLLLQCHLQRRAMPVCDYETDLRSVLDQSVRLVQALADVCALRGWRHAAAAVVAVLQRLVQALWFDEGGERALPHFSPFVTLCDFLISFFGGHFFVLKDFYNSLLLHFTFRKIISQLALRLKISALPQLCILPAATRLSFLTSNPIGLSRADALAVEAALATMPFSVRLAVEFEAEKNAENTECEKIDTDAENGQRSAAASGGKIYCRVRVDDGAGGAKVWAPKWPKPRRGGWFLAVYAESDDKLHYFGRVKGRQTVRFAMRRRESLTALLMSDSFVDFDREAKAE